jgi:hypothetical protein
VSADVIAILPADDYADEWWSMDHADTDMVVEVAPKAEAPAAPVITANSLPTTRAGWVLLLAAGAFAGTWTRMARPASPRVLFARY